MRNDNFPENTAIIVFAKTPDAPVKTRIALTEGETRAHEIYRELLHETALPLRDLPYHVAYTGNASPGELTVFFTDALSFFLQAGDDLGERMMNACLHCHSLGYTSCIVIGCDCPERTEDDLLLTAEYLNGTTDVVLGPTPDGGYQLAGVTLRGCAIFSATLWSTRDLMNETGDIITSRKLSAVYLPIHPDIDTISDYYRWKMKKH